MNQFTHCDLDGVTCAILFKKAFGPKLDKLFPCSYKSFGEKLILKTSAGPNIVITDLAMTEIQIKFAKERYDSVFLVDHHPSSIELKAKINFPKVVSQQYCASMLSYNYLKSKCNIDFSEFFYQLAFVTNDYDMWLLKNPLGLIYNELFWKMGFWDFFTRFLNEEQISAEEIKEISAQIDVKKKNIENAEKFELESTLIIFTQQDINYVSLVYPGFDLYVIIFGSSKGSIRSSKNSLKGLYEKFKNHKIIQSFSGHELAGGFQFKPTATSVDIMNFIEEVHLEFNIPF